MHPKLTETLSKYKKIILVGGGTGGHVQPIVSVIQYLRESKNPISPESNILWIGGANSQEETAARENSVEFASIPTLKLATTRSPKVLLYPFVLIAGVLEARKILSTVISTKARYERNGEILLNTWKRFLDFSQVLGIRSKGQKQSSSPGGEGWGEVCVFSKGGPGSVGIGIATWTLGMPLYIHESDTIPGRSNRILGKFAKKIFLGFESAKKYFNPEKCETIGQILHPVFYDSHCEPTKQSRKVEITKPLDRFVPRDDENQIHWKTDKKHLLIICGSQGARVIFEEILHNLEAILEKYEIILILGKLNTDMRKAFENSLSFRRGVGGVGIRLIDWISQSNLAHLIPDTDIAITRGSATTLAELTAFDQHPTVQRSNNPTLIIIPLPYSANNHQYYNALEYEKMGHTLLEQKNLHLLIETLEKIGQNSQLSNT